MNSLTRNLIVTIILMSISLGQSDRIAGKIRGSVMDGSTGDPLIGANVLVLLVESGRGAMSDINGQFVIPNIPAGTYDIQVSYIGYANHTVRDVNIVPGLTVKLNFKLNVEAVGIKAVDVIAQRDQDVVTVKTTTSKIVISGDDMQKMPVSNFTELLANTGGVVEVETGRSSGIHLRGGRSGEVAFFVDGVMTNDPVDRSQGVEIDNEAIESIVITKGGFSVEYGEAMSGVVSIVTKSGSKETYNGSFEHEGDGLFPEGGLNNGYSRTNFSLGGPIPLLKGIMSFYVNGTFLQGDQSYVRSQKLDHSDYSSPQGTFKLTFSPKYSSFNATLSANFDRTERYSYSHGISQGNWLQDYYKTVSGSQRVSLLVQSMLGKNTSWRLNVSYHEPYTDYGSGNNTSYKDFNYISTRLDWVEYAVSKEWYDPRTREWQDITDENGLPVFSEGYISYDQLVGGSSSNAVNLASLSSEFQAFYYYYFKEKDFFNVTSGTWDSEFFKMQAFNERWHDAHRWYIPSNQDTSSFFFDTTVTSATLKEFDHREFYSYLTGDEDYQIKYNLYDYNSDLHNGYYWDRDIFNVYNYGPGRPRQHIQQTINRTVEFLLNSQWSLRNNFKFGFNATTNQMMVMDIQFANQNPYFDLFEYKSGSDEYRPLTLAAFAENQFEHEDFVASFGLRWDRFKPNAKAVDQVQLLDEGEINYFDPSTKDQISPRFSLNFSASDMTSIYCNYGYFFQKPEYGDVYQGIVDPAAGLPIIGNPDVEPEKTIQYQVGMVHKFSEKIGIELSAFYKDVINAEAKRIYSTMIDGQIATVTLTEMEDFAKIKGVDIKLRFNRFFNLYGDIEYNYLTAKGTGSSSREYYYLYIFDADRPLPTKEYPLEYDITHTLKANIGYYIPPVGKGMRSLFIGNWDFNVQANFATGRAYTPEDIYGKAMELGSKRMPSTKDLDLIIRKYLGPVSFFVDIRNVFDWENVSYVYPLSGEPDSNGRPPTFEPSLYSRYVGQTNPQTGSVMRSAEEAYAAHLSLWRSLISSPYNYSSPRIVRMGLTLRF